MGVEVAAASGLVGQVTSVRKTELRCPSLNVASELRSLNRTRRVRRMRRVVIASADAARKSAERGGHRLQCVMVTLTYASESVWASRDVSGYVRRVREWLRYRRIPARYQWVIELTKKGRPHYHLLWWVPRGTRLPKPDQSGQWTLGSSRIELAFRPVGYLVKYATKGTDGELPPGSRLFGTGAPELDVRLATHRAGLPMWLSASTDPNSRCSRVARVGWVEKDSGAIHESPYELRFGRDDWGFVVITIIEKVKQ